MSVWGPENSFYYLRLWMKKSTKERYPFLEYMIEQEVPPEIYEEVMELLKYLEIKWKNKEAEGLLCFDALFVSLWRDASP